MNALLTLLAGLSLASAVLAVPGTGPDVVVPPSRDLNQFVTTEVGLITLSSDGLGMIGGTGLLQVDKPSAGATVRVAYLAAASTGFTGYVIPDGDILLAGTPVAWGLTVASGTSSYNHLADVSAIVAPILDPAGAGITNLAVTELSSDFVDGSALYVIFNDPATTEVRTAVLAFGAQATTGDNFSIGFGQPVFPDANTVIEFGLAIGYSYARGTCQTSYVDVNGFRLTSSAAGNDDGEDFNGALMTVGGVGDSRLNPADPMFNDPCSFTDYTNYDDELYNIAGYVNGGDTGMTVHTFNPSGDDNIFAAHLLLDFAAVVGEGAVLTPADATNCLCELHTVTVTVQDDNGNPVAGVPVTIQIIAGPNNGNGAGFITDANGQFSYSWIGCQEGTDVIVASFVNSQGVVEYSNHAYKHWVRCDVGTDDQPETFALSQNVPNPFNPATTISFTMPETAPARLLVYTVGGELVKSVDLGLAARGANTVQIDGSNLASGVYVYTLQSEFGSLSRKMLLMK